MLFILAAGNDGSDTSRMPSYPGAYNLPSFINVGAVNPRNDQVAVFSNYGARDVHLFAPGVNIYSTWLGSNYYTISGTSMACPHVAGRLYHAHARPAQMCT